MESALRVPLLDGAWNVLENVWLLIKLSTPAETLPSMEPLIKSVASALVTYSAHYASVKIYNYVCVPDGFTGYLTGIVTMGSPVCQVGMKLMTNTEVSYSTICIMGISRIIIDYLTPTMYKS